MARAEEPRAAGGRLGGADTAALGFSTLCRLSSPGQGRVKEPGLGGVWGPSGQIKHLAVGAAHYYWSGEVAGLVLQEAERRARPKI